MQNTLPLRGSCGTLNRKKKGGYMEIRNATTEDLHAIAAVETACFPAAEAATAEEFAGRLAHYASHFWLLLEQGKPVAFVDGFLHRYARPDR